MTYQRTAVVLAVVALVVAASPGAATVNSVDTSGTDLTASTSQIKSGTEVQLEGNDSDEHILQVNATDETDTPVADLVANNTTRVIASNSTSIVVASTTASGGHEHHNFTFSEADFKDAEHDLNENVTVHLKAYNNTSAATADLVAEPIHLNFTDDSVVEVVTDAEANGNDSSVDAADVTIKSGDGGLLSPFADDESEVAMSKHAVNNNSSVVVVMANQTVADDFSGTATDVASGDKLSQRFIGAENIVILTVNGEDYLIPVFSESAPDAWGSDNTHAVQTDDYGGETAIVLTLGSQFDDASKVEVTTIGGADAWDRRGSALLSSAELTEDRPDVTTIFGQTIKTGIMSMGSGSMDVLVLSLLPLAAAPARRGRIVIDDEDEAESPESPESPGESEAAAAAAEA